MCLHKHGDTQAAINYFDAMKKYKQYPDKKNQTQVAQPQILLKYISSGSCKKITNNF